jgi:hypothetical protein
LASISSKRFESLSNSASGKFGIENALLIESPLIAQSQKPHCSPYFSSILAQIPPFGFVLKFDP